MNMNPHHSQNLGRLSAISAVLVLSIVALGERAVAQSNVSPEFQAQVRQVGRACRSDALRYCSGIQPGGGRILACLEGNVERLSERCRTAIPAAVSLQKQAIKDGTMPK